MVADAPDGTTTYTVMPVDGVPIAAWRFPTTRDRCWAGAGTVNGGWAGALAHWHGDAELMTVEDRIDVAPVGHLGVDAIPLLLTSPLVGSMRTVERLVASPDVTVAHIAPSSSVVIVPTGQAPMSVCDGHCYDPDVEGDHAVWAEASTAFRLWHWRPTTGAEIYFDPGDVIEAPAIDGGTLVWIRAVDFVSGMATRAELWASPLTPDGADLTPRLIHPDVGDHTYLVFADGEYFALLDAGVTFTGQLIDVADGRVRVLRSPEPSAACAGALYASRSDVFLDCGIAGHDGPTYYRIDPRTIPYEP
jgi:hypothetical protein